MFKAQEMITAVLTETVELALSRRHLNLTLAFDFKMGVQSSPVQACDASMIMLPAQVTPCEQSKDSSDWLLEIVQSHLSTGMSSVSPRLLAFAGGGSLGPNACRTSLFCAAQVGEGPVVLVRPAEDASGVDIPVAITATVQPL